MAIAANAVPAKKFHGKYSLDMIREKHDSSSVSASALPDECGALRPSRNGF